MAVETPSLLIVHQNPNMAKTLATILSDEYDIYIAKQASQVSPIIESHPIHLVLASQQLPDSTGLVLFTELRRSRPHVVRILLVTDEDKRSIDVGEALSREIVHRYLEEPLTSSLFIEAVRKGIQLYETVESAVQPAERAPEMEKQELIETQGTIPEEALEGPVPEASAPDTSEADTLQHVSQAYGVSMQQEHERQQALELLEEKQALIVNLEALQKQLMQEKAELLERLLQTQKENAAMGVLRQENARLTDENARLQGEQKAFEQRIDSLVAQSEELGSELEEVRSQLSSLGMLQALGTVKALTAKELRDSIDPLEIYEKSAVWCTQLTQLQKLNSLLDLKAHRSDREISELQEQIDGMRVQFEGEKSGLIKKLNEYEVQYQTFMQRLAAQIALCEELKREKDELAGKLL